MPDPTRRPRMIRAAAGTPLFLDIVDAAVPRLPGHDHARPMCAAWDDHLHREVAHLAEEVRRG